MTIEKKKVPPIVPMKKPGLKSSKIDDENQIILPNLKAREEPPQEYYHRNHQNMNTLIDQISLNTEFSVPKQRKHEPKVLKLDDVLKPVIRNDIKINHTPIIQQTKKQPPIVKPKPVMRPKPVPKPKLNSSPKPNQHAEPVQRFDNTPDFLKETMQRRLQLSNAIPLPGLVTKSQTTSPYKTLQVPSALKKSHTMPAFSAKFPEPLVHPNKRRSKGPRRRLPTQVSQDSSQNTSNIDISTQKKKPPVPPKKKIVF